MRLAGRESQHGLRAYIEIAGDGQERTFRHVGVNVHGSGKKVADFFGEVFIARRLDGTWKIKLTVLNTDPFQGKG